MAQEKKERIFISYKRVDKERVFAIKDGIEQAIGEKCWIDLEGIESNAQFAAKIMTAINQCDVFLFMRSKEHNKIVDLETDWTYRELNYALAKKKNIVFVNLDNSPMPDWVTFIFPHKQEVDSTDLDKLARLNKDLCEWLGITSSTVPQPAKVEISTNPAPSKPTVVQTPVNIEQAKREALPAGKFKVGELSYRASENSSGVTVCGLVNKAATVIHIPSQIKYRKYIYEVTSIGKDAFLYCSGLTSITIPNSVKSIGEYAFDGCSGLTAITIPNSVTSIGKGAFSGCVSLTSITIPNSVTSIGERAFYKCSGLTAITIPNSVTSIGKGAFAWCSRLTSITIPNSVTSIGENAFSICSGLTSITIPNSVTSIGKDAFIWCEGLTSISIPNSVTSIGNGAFYSCNALTSITIPNSVTSIGEKAFYCCPRLTSITIPNSVTSIGGGAFNGCSSLKSIKIPKSLTNIGVDAFPYHTKVIRE